MGRIVRRVGPGGQFRGANKQADPSAIGEDQFTHLENARWNGGAIVERGGQSKLLGSALSPALITGIYDSSIGGSLVGGTSGGGGGGGPVGTGGGGGGPTPPGSGDGPKIYWPAVTAGPTARWVMYFDEEKSNAPFSNNTFAIDTTAAQTEGGTARAVTGVAVQWNGQLWWVIGDTTGWGLYSQEPAYGTNQPLPVKRLFVLTTVTGLTACMGVWRGDLYISLKATTASDNVITYRYNGTTLSRVDDSGVAATTGQPFGYQDKLYVSFNTNSNTIRYISIAGTGANATMPSTIFQAAATPTHNNWAEYKGTLYTCGTDGNGGGVSQARGVIYSTTGSSFAVAHDLGTGVAGSANPVRCLAVFNGYLYFIWNDISAPMIDIVGRYDGTTWTNTHFSFPTGAFSFDQLFPYKGDLVAVSSGGTQYPAYRSTGTDTTTWTGMQAIATTGKERLVRATPFY